MRVLGRLKQKEITEFLQKGTSVVEKIKQELNISSPISFGDLCTHVIADLRSMGYEIGYDSNNNVLFDEHAQLSIPSIAMETQDKDGKTVKVILLNKNFPEEAQTEALFHEYIHIKDDTLPRIEDLFGNKDGLYKLENMVDITTYILIMPPDEMRRYLEKHNYKITKILNEYYDRFERCSVLQWITFHSDIPCHFAWVMNIKNIDNSSTKKKVIYDSYFYEQGKDPVEYDIDNVLTNYKDSAVAQAVKNEKYELNKESVIDSSKYQCYAYYEKGLDRTLCTADLEKHVVQYDRLLVIGWKRSRYDEFQKKKRQRGNIIANLIK